MKLPQFIAKLIPQRVSQASNASTVRAARASSKGVDYAPSPLLAEPTPNWRSRFVVALVGLGFAGLLA